MYSYVARQPIFDFERQTFGYELLFRDGDSNAYPTHVCSDKATTRLLVENFMSIGTNPAQHESRCFINFPQQALLELVPLTLPKDHIVIEVLESCQPTDELFQAIIKLSKKGYQIAFDDFEHSPEWDRFLAYANFVKIDIMALGLPQACILAKSLIAKGLTCQFVAERIETELEFKIARNAGFTLFQGYFFSKPLLSKNKCLMGDQLTALELLEEVSRPEVDFSKVEAILIKDVALSFKLLRFVNALSSRLEVEITSFHQALIYLGQAQLKQFISLVAASQLAGNKPEELYLLSMQRARFCSLVSRHPSLTAYQGQAFVVGLFSLLDALLDKPLAELVMLLPLSKEIKLALTDREGAFGHVLDMEEAFEHGDWGTIETRCLQLDLDLEWVSQQLARAQRWSQALRTTEKL